MKTCLRSFAVFLPLIAGYGNAASAATLNVQVNDASGKPVQDAAVYAEPATPTPLTRLSGAEIEQKSRKFMPAMTVVQTGTEVGFPNNDTVRHHVYSFSAPKPFELKLYSGKPGTPVVFDKPGTVVIGCNIHDQMIAYIHIVNTPHFGKTDQAGKVTIPDLGPGKYKLKAWHHQMPPAATPTETEINVAKNDAAASLVIGITVTGSSH